MARDLPSMDSLRAFARAARTGSFKRAADELHVSASALSRRIQTLEEHLGTALFRRLNPGLELTEAGARYREAVDAALAKLEAAQDEIAPTAKRTLRISTLVSFCEAWLVPSLPEFERAYPDVAVEVEATLRYADFQRDRVDVAIRFGTGPWNGLYSEPLTRLDFFPVCAPALLEGDEPLVEPRDLARHTLIHVAQTPEIWRSWLRAAGEPDLKPRRELCFDHVALVLAAAGSGQGVALSTPLGCGARLRAGTLVRPFALSIPSPATYHFVCRPEGLQDPAICALRDWLMSGLR